MRELDRCDFCAERADGVYEVLPPEVDAAERRLVLCADCRDTLAGVVDPLLDALEARDAPTPEGDGADRSVTLEPPASEVGTEGRDAAAADAERDDGDDGDAAHETADDEDGEDRDTTADADDASGDDAPDDANETEAAARPEGYRRVVRLLRNRPAAMTRSDLAELASGAYDLDADDVDGIVDAALENGHLEETAEGLRAT